MAQFLSKGTPWARAAAAQQLNRQVFTGQLSGMNAFAVTQTMGVGAVSSFCSCQHPAIMAQFSSKGTPWTRAAAAQQLNRQVFIGQLSGMNAFAVSQAMGVGAVCSFRSCQHPAIMAQFSSKGTPWTRAAAAQQLNRQVFIGQLSGMNAFAVSQAMGVGAVCSFRSCQHPAIMAQFSSKGTPWTRAAAAQQLNRQVFIGQLSGMNAFAVSQAMGVGAVTGIRGAGITFGASPRYFNTSSRSFASAAPKTEPNLSFKFVSDVEECKSATETAKEIALYITNKEEASRSRVEKSMNKIAENIAALQKETVDQSNELRKETVSLYKELRKETVEQSKAINRIYDRILTYSFGAVTAFGVTLGIFAAIPNLLKLFGGN